MSDAYAAAGVDTAQSDAGVEAIVGVLGNIESGSKSRVVDLPGHYAAVLEVAPNLGIAIGTDSAGSKVIVAEETGRFDTIGIDCVAMNVNDVVCVGAEPIALVDYLAVEQADPKVLEQIAVGLKVGAEAAGVEVPGGELAVLPDVIKGHPSPYGFDIVGTAIGTVALDGLVTGAERAPGDVVIGLPSSGIHSNGYTLARRALGKLALGDRPEQLGGPSVADALLEPTVIYVRAALELLRSDIPVHFLAHITGGGVTNLLRGTRGAEIGYELDAPLGVPPVFALIAELEDVPAEEMWEVFNMGCGFACVVPAEHEEAATALLAKHHPGSRRIGRITAEAGRVTLPGLGLSYSKA
jgi:phosphoribosylformylglycinamidine cyclo-ligase